MSSLKLCGKSSGVEFWSFWGENHGVSDFVKIGSFKLSIPSDRVFSEHSEYL